MHEFVKILKKIPRVFVIIGGDADTFKLPRTFDFFAGRICKFLAAEGIMCMKAKQVI